MTRAVHLLVPGRLDQRTGGYLYDARIVAGLRASGWRVDVHELPGRYPDVDAVTCQQAETRLARVPDGALCVIDGLAIPGVAGALWTERLRLRLVHLIHHPLSLETGLDPGLAAAVANLERAAFAVARRIVVTSPFTASTLADTMTGTFAVPRDRIGVVVPGTDPKPQAAGSGGAVPTVLCVGTLTARKGHLILLDALAMLRDLPWRLVCAGSAERDLATGAAVRARIAERDLADRVELAGEVDAAALDALYGRADLFVLASHYEGYGMAVAEAIARGLPTVTTTGGALAVSVPPGAAVQVPPGDAAALADGLRPLLSDAGAREALAARALVAASTLPTWDAQASAFAAELERALEAGR
jgi:glycosyltransferase involved in cell wall biosynthesis